MLLPAAVRTRCQTEPLWLNAGARNSTLSALSEKFGEAARASGAARHAATSFGSGAASARASFAPHGARGSRPSFMPHDAGALRGVNRLVQECVAGLH